MRYQYGADAYRHGNGQHQAQIRVLDEFVHNNSAGGPRRPTQAEMEYEMMEISDYLHFKASHPSPQIGSGLGGHCQRCQHRHPLPHGLQDWRCPQCSHYNQINLSWEY
ncbi:Uncharacterized protein PBTT_10311 [Plasmodiophora brassicae]